MKRLFSIVLCLSLVVISGQYAHADIFAPVGESHNLKATEAVAIPGVDSNTILANVAQITSYLGVREGALYDFGQHEFCNYAAATVVSFEPYGLSIDVGAVNADGVAETIDWNAGKFIPAQNVPLLNFLQYLYIGGGLAERSIDGDWKTSAVIDAQFKTTF